MRMIQAWEDFEAKKIGAKLIQRKWRSTMAKRAARECGAAVMIQGIARMRRAKATYKRSRGSIVALQAAIRGRKAVKAFEKKVGAAVAIESAVRAFTQKRRYAKVRARTIGLQAVIRGFVARASYSRMLSAAREASAAVRIQKVFRGWTARDDLTFQGFAATTIQRMFRGSSQQVKYMLTLLNVLKAQAVVRGYQARNDLAYKKYASITIQSRFRVVLAKRIAESARAAIFYGKVRALGERNAARKIQGGVRDLLRRLKVERNADILNRIARGFLARRRARGAMKALLALQGMWRGRVVRKKTGKRMRVIRLKIALANENALKNPELTLGVRTLRALEVVMNSKSLALIMKAVTTLEVSSRFSEKCAENVAAAGAPAVLIELITTLNRSLPHVELIQFSLMTMQNVGRHEHLVDSVAIPSAVGALMDVMGNYRDREMVHFLCCELMLLLVSTAPSCADQFRERQCLTRARGILALQKRSVGILTVKSSSNIRLARGTGKPKTDKDKVKAHAVSVLGAVFRAVGEEAEK